MSTFDQPGWSFDQTGATFDGANGKPLWLSIASTPALHIYAETDALPFIPPGQRAAQVLQSVGDLQAELDGITPSLSVQLANGAGQSTTLLHTRPPLGAVAILYRGTEPLFRGIVQRITLGSDATIEVQA